MKTKMVRVVVEKEIEVSIPDECLTSEYMKEFSNFMFEVENEDDLFKYAAEQLFNNYDQHIEGLGEAKWKGTCMKINPDDILYQQEYEEVESEIM